MPRGTGSLRDRIIALKRKMPSLGPGDIAREIGTPHGYAARVLRKAFPGQTITRRRREPTGKTPAEGTVSYRIMQAKEQNPFAGPSEIARIAKTGHGNVIHTVEDLGRRGFSHSSFPSKKRTDLGSVRASVLRAIWRDPKLTAKQIAQHLNEEAAKQADITDKALTELTVENAIRKARKKGYPIRPTKAERIEWLKVQIGALNRRLDKLSNAHTTKLTKAKTAERKGLDELFLIEAGKIIRQIGTLRQEIIETRKK